MSVSIALGVAFGIGSAGYLALAWYVWRHRRAAGGRGLVTMSLAVFVWTAFYGMEFISQTPDANKAWSALKFIGIVAVVPGLAWFVDEYTGRRMLGRRGLLLLCIEPVIVLVALAIPATHDLVHYYPAEARAEEVAASRPVPVPGLLFWPHAVYTYLGVAICTAILARRLVRVARPYRRQAYAIIVGTGLPLVVNLLYNAELVGEVDPTPFAFVLTASVLFWGFFRLRLLDIVPVARHVVVEQMTDGVVVLDAYGRIVDANPATAVLLGDRRSRVVGRALCDLMPALAPALGRHIPGTTTRDDVALSGLGGVETDISLILTSLFDRVGAETGRLAVLRDVTQQMRIQRELQALLDQQTRIAETLEASLRPSRLPDVPGLRLAARSLPSGVGSQVSGDFYDVHPATRGEWAFVLGDVSGKGVEAAIVTSMARYTVRALSAQGWSPQQVLEQLNATLELGEEDVERFCTVVYGRITAAPAPGAVTGVRLTISLGGHPAPFVRRADGTVFAVGIPGTAIGLLHDVSVSETVVDLAPGDVLLAYTDGVTEARRNGEEFGDERLAEVLAGTAAGLRGRTGAAAASLVADAVADRVVKEVVEFAYDRDDVALLVLAVA